MSEPPPLSRLELLVFDLDIPFGEVEFDQQVASVRRYLRREMDRRVRASVRTSKTIDIECPRCGQVREVYEKRVREVSPLCDECSFDPITPSEEELRWAADQPVEIQAAVTALL